MPSMFIFGCPELKKRFCEIPFPKSIVYSDAVLDNLRQRYKSIFPSKYSESQTLKSADELCPWVLKFS